MGLVMKGVPFDVAFSLAAEFRTGFSIIAGELEGGTFDFSRWEWEKT